MLPVLIKKGLKSSLHFQITKEAIDIFSELTGDRSPLHTEDEFARRSIYRATVAQGMLSAVFAGLLDFLNIKGYRTVPVEWSARFMEPVFAGMRLSISGELTEIDADGLCSVDFTVRNENSSSISCKGSLTVLFALGQSEPESLTAAEFALPDGKLGLTEARFENISKGDPDGFTFSLKDGSLAALMRIIALSTGKQPVETGFDFEALLPALLLSTSVGMCIPGRHATFLEFNASFSGKANKGTGYALEGQVCHVSAATRIIKKAVSIKAPSREPVMSGKVAILVNEPQKEMPAVMEIKDNAFDLGLKGKVVLVTGASRGIGETTAKLFSLHGSKVVINYNRGENDAKRVADEISASGGDAVIFQADVSNTDQVKLMVSEAVKRFGRIDVLVNNAVRDFRPQNFLNLSWDDIQKDIDVTVKGAYNCCREVIPLFLENGGGRIINISTIAVENPPPGQFKYVVSKSALVGLTRSLAVEFASRNIQVNMVVPNFVETDLVSHIPGAYRKKMAQDVPMQRGASPVDVAQAVVFLASAYSSFTTGQKLMVTGGTPPYL